MQGRNRRQSSSHVPFRDSEAVVWAEGRNEPRLGSSCDILRIRVRPSESESRCRGPRRRRPGPGYGHWQESRWPHPYAARNRTLCHACPLQHAPRTVGRSFRYRNGLGRAAAACPAAACRGDAGSHDWLHRPGGAGARRGEMTNMGSTKSCELLEPCKAGIGSHRVTFHFGRQ